jgi:hypothetical protein
LLIVLRLAWPSFLANHPTDQQINDVYEDPNERNTNEKICWYVLAMRIPTFARSLEFLREVIDAFEPQGCFQRTHRQPI